MDTILKKDSLRELSSDTRDFVLGAVFGTIDLKDVPLIDFKVAEPLVIKDQGQTDYCSAYAITSVSEDQEGVELMPEFQFYITKKIDGNAKAWGADLRVACKSAVDYGSVPTDRFPELLGQSRDFILNSRNWPTSSEPIAMIYKKETYFSVKGPYDVFDNIRTALWQHRNEKSTIITGATFREGWLYGQGGVIPSEYDTDGFGHAFKIFGQKVINGELHLMAQLSQGKNVGDSGIFYFNREVTNREIGKFGIFMFKDTPREEAEYYIRQPFDKSTPLLKIAWIIISNLFKK